MRLYVQSMVWGDFPYQELRNYKIKTSIFDHIQIIFFVCLFGKRY